MKRSVLLAGAIAFGILVITGVNAFTAGISGNIRTNFSHVFGGNIFVSGSMVTDSGRSVSRITDDTHLEQLLGEDLGVRSVHRRSRAFATLIFGARQASERIDGVDFAAETELLRALPVVSGSLDHLDDERSLVLPRGTAQRLGVEAGEMVLVRLLTVTGQQNVGDFRVAAIIDDGGTFGLTTAYAHLSHLNRLLGLGPSEYQMVNLVLDDLRNVDAVAYRLAQGLLDRGAVVARPLHNPAGSVGDLQREGQAAFAALFGFSMGGVTAERWEGTKFTITTLNELLEPLQSALGVVDAIAFGIFAILLVITMAGITNTFRMVLIERTREIGTMRAFGMQRSTVRGIFLLEAVVIALAGAAAGLLLAGVVAAIVSRVSFAHVEGLQFFLDGGRFTLPITAAGVLLNIGILLTMSLLAAFFPAKAAARLEPAKALGTHF